jgi:site-specific DNA-methyltransferase (adenine-specific)
MIRALPLNQILMGDCVQVMDSLPEKSVDLVFADPPYNLQLQRTLWRPDMSRVDAVDDEWDHFEGFAAYDHFTSAWLTACRRVLKDTGTLWVIGSYHNIYRVGTILMDLGYWILNDIVWIKTNPMPNFRGVRFTNAHETMLWVQKIKGARYTFNYQSMKTMNDDLQMRSDWELPLCTGQERARLNGVKGHSTQKPEALLYRVLSASSRPGDVVLDPFFGSGTTGAVARKLQRNWIGIERDPDYIQLARQRMDSIPEREPEPELFTSPSRREHPRVSFGSLLEHGYLQAGQQLFFGRTGLIATVLADGYLRMGEKTGSIHTLGRELRNAPCNGWEQWFYMDETRGEKLPLDVLRQKYLQSAK